MEQFVDGFSQLDRALNALEQTLTDMEAFVLSRVWPSIGKLPISYPQNNQFRSNYSQENRHGTWNIVVGRRSFPNGPPFRGHFFVLLSIKTFSEAFANALSPFLTSEVTCHVSQWVSFCPAFSVSESKKCHQKMLISVVYQYIPYDTTFVYICVLYKMMEWQRKIRSNWYGTYGTAKNGREKMRGPTSLVDEVLLMLQKSQTTTFWMVLKPCKSWDKLPISTGEFTGFLPNNRTSWSFFPGSIAVQFDTVLHPPCQALHIEPCDQHDEDNPCLCSTSISLKKKSGERHQLESTKNIYIVNRISKT